MVTNMENKRVYITILSDSLEKKLDVLKKLLLVTKEQNMILSEKDIDKFDVYGFDTAVEKKEKLIGQMQELDKGFDTVYAKVGRFLSENKEEYILSTMGLSKKEFLDYGFQMLYCSIAKEKKL